MIYREYQPHPALLHYIETYWVADGYVEQGESHRILPDGCVDIIFSFGYSSPNDNLVHYIPNIVGTMTTFSDVSYFREVSMLGIRFKPVGITAFMRVPMDSFTDMRTDMRLIDTVFDESFYAQLPELDGNFERIACVDSYFLKSLKNIFELDNQIVYATDLIRETKGQLSLSEIASKSCLSLRHFERRFKMAVGVSPKTFSKIEKFKHTLSYLKENRNTSLFSAAIECGYYDQSHLIKEFNILTGKSPSLFRKT